MRENVLGAWRRSMEEVGQAAGCEAEQVFPGRRDDGGSPNLSLCCRSALSSSCCLPLAARRGPIRGLEALGLFSLSVPGAPPCLPALNGLKGLAAAACSALFPACGKFRGIKRARCGAI